MLEEIHVENLLIIDELRAGLHPGLNVISGETGVGKSLLLSSVGLLLGSKVEVEVQDGKELRVQGRFRLDSGDVLAAADLLDEELDDGELVVRVVKKAGGQQRCYLNGAMISRRELARLGRRLVDVHGQRDMQKLLDRKEQVAVLDLYAGTGELAASFSTALEEWRAAHRKLEDRLETERRLVERLDLLRFQRDELEAAGVELGEKEDLEGRHKRLAVARDAAAAAGRAVDAIEEEGDGVVDRLQRIGKDLENLGDRDPELAALAERAYEAADGVAEFARDLQDVGQSRARMDEDPEELAERLDLLNGLERKYRRDAAGLLAYLEEALVEIEALETELEKLDDLDSHTSSLERGMLELGTELRRRRERAGKRLSKAVEGELTQLKMPHAKFQVDPGLAPEKFDPDLVTSRGFGEPGFLLRSNPGSPFAALEDSASGGELSRVLLALKSVLADSHNLPLMIFDEIETGVGPRLGMLLGAKLKALAEHRQVLCITHLPQIAAYADRHLRIDKQVKGKKTRALLEKIEGKDRVSELAAMLGGGDEKLARRQATKLLEDAASGRVAVEESA